MTRSIIRLLSLLLGLSLAGSASAQPAAQALAKAGKAASSSKKPAKPKAPAMITTDSGLQYVDTRIGSGASPARGQRIIVHYTGWLSDRGKKGKKFDSSLDRGEPLTIPVGVGKLIKGWDEGLLTMKVSGKRTLVVPPHLGYGARGAGADIPPNAELIFEVELIGVQ